MRNFLDDLEVEGHLEITKVYVSGGEEVIFDDHNVIVTGMGVGLAHLFSLSGSVNILNYQIDRFQIGVSGTPGREVASTNELGSPLNSLQEYGENALLYVVSGNHALDVNTIKANQWFGYIPQHKVSRVGVNSVRYTITLDRDAANNLRGGDTFINEIGLFMKNPLGEQANNVDTSILVAYRKFQDILKTEDFALIFRWTINW